MKYIYKHTETRDTTGYFACIPEPEPELEESLRLLLERPTDSFLFRYIMRRILDNPESRLTLEKYIHSQVSIIQNLLKEVAAFSPEIRRMLTRPSGLPGTLPSRIQGGDDGSTDKVLALRLNIHQHKELPELAKSPDLEDHWQLIQKRQKKKLLPLSKDLESAGHGQNLKELYNRILELLRGAGICDAGEMRHEASLSPIALLRHWNIRAGIDGGSTQHELTGHSIAYGRGLTLAQARISCIMEVVERASAYAFFNSSASGPRTSDQILIKDSWLSLASKGLNAVNPLVLGSKRDSESWKIYWVEGLNSDGETILIPAQAVYLFCNLDEPDLGLETGSTGMAAGESMEQARLGAVMEVIERYSHASMPFRKDDCFELASRDKVIQSLLDDYRWRGIRLQFQDITTELGFPAYRCFVQGLDGRIAQATGAGLNGSSAILAALTETPWPYSWSIPVPAPSGRGIPNLHMRLLEDMPNYSSGNMSSDLRSVERFLHEQSLDIAYADITRKDLGIPVCRAIIPGLEIDADLENGPGKSLLARTIFRG